MLLGVLNAHIPTTTDKPKWQFKQEIIPLKAQQVSFHLILGNGITCAE